MEINNIIKKLLIRYPLFGNIIVNLQFCLCSDLVPAPAYTNGECIFYKQDFIDYFTDAEQEFIIAHEIFHIVLNHLSRNIGKDKDLLNFVEDAIINQLLVRDGLTMPSGVIYIPDALDYSVEELYMKYLPYLQQIKEWMNSNTYHMGISEIETWINKIYSKDLEELMDENSKINSTDLEELMNENSKIRSKILDNYQEQLKYDANAIKTSLGIEFPSVNVGKSKAILDWKNLLNKSIYSPDESTTSFYEVEMDGIIKKEEKPTESDSESEIIIDSSFSMQMPKIKAILRECKNILTASHMKVGFFDIEFYGWNEIKTEKDIDNLQIVGRGCTDFVKMVECFSNNADNKIILTDGECIYPDNCPCVLWIIFNDLTPEHYDPNFFQKKINYIFINTKDIPAPEKNKQLILERK